MRLQQKQPLQIQYSLIKGVAQAEQKLNQSMIVFLPKLHTIYSKNKNSCFKEYQSGSRIINQIPLLIFNSQKRETNRNSRFQRHSTQQKKSQILDTVNPFFKSYIRKSIQKRKMVRSLDQKSQQKGKKCLIQVVSLDCLSINNPSTTKSSFKILSPSKPNSTFARYETTPSNDINIEVISKEIKKKPEQLLLQKRQLRITKRQTNRFQKIKLKLGPERTQIRIIKEDELSPWRMSSPLEHLQ